jgi:uncharacterized protein YneF (UPF0154 family)
MLTESQKFALALTLFAVAVFLAGMKQGIFFANRYVAAKFANAIVIAIHLAQKNTDNPLISESADMNIGGVKDTITVNSFLKTVQSKKNFRYNYHGTRVECSVNYMKNEKVYNVSCQAY